MFSGMDESGNLQPMVAPSETFEEATESESQPDRESSPRVEPLESHDSAKHLQLVDTLKWLSENYERSAGVCLPRCVLYTHYLDFCKKNQYSPSSAATFGKVIRQQFPKLTTRRLGTRGQSKYHYYGISIRRTSIYYHSVYSGPGLTRFSEKKPDTENSNKKFSLSSKAGTLLPEYPDAANLVLPADVPQEKVETFILMYRTHSQRLLDVIVSNNFDEVQNFLLHFWQGLPSHLSSLLTCDVINDVIILCDSILYKVLNEILIPGVIQEIPEGLSSEIRQFSRKLPMWLEMSLDQIPEGLKQRKLTVVRAFVQSIRRQMAFIHLAQSARSVLMSHELIREMMGDLKELTSTEFILQPALSSDMRTHTVELLGEFEDLMSKQAPLESFVQWIDFVINKFILKELASEPDSGHFTNMSSSFLMSWSFVTGRLMAELTLRSVKSFGHFHLIHLMLQEYALLAIETQHDKIIHAGYQRNVQRHMKETAEISTKAKVRSSSRKMSSSHAHKAKKRRASEVEAEAPEACLQTMVYTSPSNQQPIGQNPTRGQDMDSIVDSAPQNYLPLDSARCDTERNRFSSYKGSVPHTYPTEHAGAPPPQQSYNNTYPYYSSVQNENTFYGASLHVPYVNSYPSNVPPYQPMWDAAPSGSGYGVYAELSSSYSPSATSNSSQVDTRAQGFRSFSNDFPRVTNEGAMRISSPLLPHRLGRGLERSDGYVRGVALARDSMPVFQGLDLHGLNDRNSVPYYDNS
ncbi:DNA-binding protein RFX6-like [Diadema setosum]|uniref:DNA-binding protein RFX6-like n=1 Tax=Diadema setosum TaxID=31175 RepID=UPI003B3AB85E